MDILGLGPPSVCVATPLPPPNTQVLEPPLFTGNTRGTCIPTFWTGGTVNITSVTISPNSINSFPQISQNFTRCQISQPKCTKIIFFGCCPSHPILRAYSVPPNPLVFTRWIGKENGNTNIRRQYPPPHTHTLFGPE